MERARWVTTHCSVLVVLMAVPLRTVQGEGTHRLGAGTATLESRGQGCARRAVPPVLLPVEIADPAFPEAAPRELQVEQARDADGFPCGYSVRILTKVCMDNKCRPIDVTLHWTAAGLFDRLECAPGQPLTKKEHEPFVPADYAKLERILKDRASILSRHSLAFLAKPKAEQGGIDVWSGATPQTVQEAVVEDAAYTSWVLWQWANGPLVETLCGFTEQSCTPPYLTRLLHSEDRGCVAFALRFLAKRPAAVGRQVEDVLSVVERGDRELIAAALRLLKGASGNREEVFARLIRAASRMNSVDSPMVLDFLAGEPHLPVATLDELTSYLGRMPYFQIHLTLRILEQRKYCSSETEADVLALLEGTDFFIARRGFEFLVKQTLSREAGLKVARFRERNRDRL